MATKFDIAITATDRATNVIQRINRSMSGVLRPAQQVGRATRALASEAWSNPMVRGVRKVGAAAWWAKNKIVAFASPLAAIAGVGTAAGIAKLVDSWATAGVTLENMTRRTGLAKRQLLEYRGAGMLAGVGADAMSNAMVRLGDTLQDALYGRNQQALMLLGRLGITIKRNAAGVVDTESALLDLSDAIAKIGSPQTQALVARAFGLEEALPILQKGSGEIRKYTKAARDMGVADEDAAKSKLELGRAWDRLKVASMGASDALAKSFVGRGLAATLDRLSDMLTKTAQAEGYINKQRQATPALSALFGGGLLHKFWSRVPATPAGMMAGAAERAAPATPAGRPAPREVRGTIGAPATPRRRSGRGASASWAPATPAPTVIPTPPGRRLPRGLRQNNPGNLRYAGQPGAVPLRGFAAFPTPQAGLVAMAKQLRLEGTRGIATIQDLLQKYAPPSENDTAAYAASVARQTGYASTERIDLRDPEVLKRIMPAMIRQEQGMQPFDADAIGRAVADALAKRPPPQATVRVEAAPGVRTKTRLDGAEGGAQVTRIAYSMPGAF